MIFIKGGQFVMGSPETEEDRFDNERQHEVEVGDFYLGKCPVTNAEYRRFKPDHDSGGGFNDDDQPVVRVSWHDATAYADWLSRETGEDYRLPTEAEREYACRAGTTSRYCFGEDDQQLGEYAWYIENSEWVTHPVGQKKPNPWGLHDMHGNVLEWTCSAYDDDCDGPKVLRGGCWNFDASNARAANRDFSSPGDRCYFVGFRLARTIKP
ncbi:MAG: formylglycine-generating enzyme family protein [Gammaproteobacteria bacterium]|nr:formylglycine-generating enzyme family protein [Gammaproteobacteria bacterium]MBU1655191.1 formylglycine-generating enzyme family protein [Gammaproteobacteria bacterium]MBU1960002.1 formylglycine-generating enzyme family protein [Gammaproteobacteria bacterium]